MTGKVSYEALKKRVTDLEKEVSTLKRSESELRDSEAQLRAFMNHYPAVIYIKDEEGKHIFANDAALKITNRKVKNFLGTTSRDFFPPDIAKEIEDRDEFVLKKGIPTDLEYQNEMPDGQVHWIKDIKFPIPLAEQTLLGGIGVDITEHKQREETLEIMQFAVDHALDRIAWIAPDGRFLYANEEACKEMEYTLEKVLSMRVSDIDPNFPVERWAEHYQEVKKRGSMRLETQQIAGDGQIHDIEVSANYLKFGDREFMCVFGRDVTERRRAEEALKSSERKYRTLTENLNVGVFRNTPGSKGKFIEVNPAFLKMFGYESRDELLSMDVSELYEDPNNRNAYNEKIRKQGYLRDEQNTYRRKDGTTFIGSVSAVAVKDDTGQALYYDGIVEDITERKEIERALQQNQNDLQRLAGKLISTQEAERRRLAREMHDDISQRLAILAIDTEKLVRLREDPEDPLFKMLQDVRERLVDLSSDIHAISRQLHPSILDDLGLADAVLAECEGFRSREQITVKCEAESMPSELPKDTALALFRIVQEGLRNVAKHAQTQNVNVSLFGKDDSIHLNISDDGVGFDYSEARRKPGLGLASMEERVRLIQGDISIRSEPGEGTLIKVRAPLASN